MKLLFLGAKRLKTAFIEHKIFLLILLTGALVKGGILLLSPITGFEFSFFILTRELSKRGIMPYFDYYPAHPPPSLLLATLLPPVIGNRALTFILWLFSLIMLYLLTLNYGKRHALLVSAMFSFLGVVSLISSPHALWDQLVAFFILLALLLLSKGKSGLFGLSIAAATSVKIWPAFLLFALIKRPIALIKAIGVFLFALAILWMPFLMISPLMLLSTFAYNFGRGPWQTPWALMDGWWGSGGALDFSLTYNTYFALHGWQQDWPVWERLNNGTFLAFYSWNIPALETVSKIASALAIPIVALLLRTGKHDDLVLRGVAFTALYFALAKGWSNGWEVFVLPILLIGATTPWRKAFILTFLIGNFIHHLYFFNPFRFQVPFAYETLFSLIPFRLLLLAAVVFKTVAFWGIAISLLKGHLINLSSFFSITNFWRKGGSMRRMKDACIKKLRSRGFLSSCLLVLLSGTAFVSILAHIGFDTPLRIYQPYTNMAQVEIPTQTGTWYYLALESQTTADWTLYSPRGLIAEWQEQRYVTLNLKAEADSYSVLVRNKERLGPRELTKGAVVIASSEFDEHHRAENPIRHPGREWSISPVYGIAGQWIKVTWDEEVPVETILIQSRLSERDPALKKASFVFSGGEEFEIAFPESRAIQEVSFSPPIRSSFVKIIIKEVYPAKTSNFGLRYLRVYSYPTGMQESNLVIWVIPGNIIQACAGLLVTALGLALGITGIVYFALPRESRSV